MNLRICSSRSTTTDSVGVCTRPTVVRKKPPSRELNAVMARVPLMPTSQSASERERAARVTGVDQVRYVRALGLLDDGVQPGLGLVYRLQVEVRRDHRQVRKAP